LCELPLPEALEGVSAVSLLNGSKSPIRKTASTVVARGPNGAGNQLDFSQLGRSIRSDRWRYTEWFDGNLELYDYENDPHEHHNLAKSADSAAIVEEHRKLLAELRSD
jgi:uncharacterized sulfatase